MGYRIGVASRATHGSPCIQRVVSSTLPTTDTVTVGVTQVLAFTGFSPATQPHHVDPGVPVVNKIGSIR